MDKARAVVQDRTSAVLTQDLKVTLVGQDKTSAIQVPGLKVTLVVGQVKTLVTQVLDLKVTLVVGQVKASAIQILGLNVTLVVGQVKTLVIQVRGHKATHLVDLAKEEGVKAGALRDSQGMVLVTEVAMAGLAAIRVVGLRAVDRLEARTGVGGAVETKDTRVEAPPMGKEDLDIKQQLDNCFL